MNMHKLSLLHMIELDRCPVIGLAARTLYRTHSNTAR